MPTILRTSCP